MSPKTLVVIVGPTASGKTDLAIRMAQHFGTDVVSADSRQVYRGMAIGTAQPTPQQLAAVKHHFIAVRSVREPYDAAAYGNDALAVINTLFETHDYAVLCGGSGLYIKAVLEGFDEMPAVPAGVREAINSEYRQHGLEWLQAQVQLADPGYYAIVDRMNPQRLIRALELYRGASTQMSALRNRASRSLPFRVIKLGLTLPKTELDARIDRRVDDMVQQGLLDEVRSFSKDREQNALQTVGYQELFRHFDGELTIDEAVALIKRNTKLYAKRQMTWFRKDKEIRWFHPGDWDEMINVAGSLQ